MSATGGKLPKPILRWLASRHMIRILIDSTVVGFIGATIAYNYYFLPRANKLIDFYKTYDADAAFERMRKRGVFDSIPAD